MSLEDFITTYNGQVIGSGQCGDLVALYWKEVDDYICPSYPDAKDYWSNPVPGYVQTSNPTPGDVAVYQGHDAFPEGHIAVYVGSDVFEQNADPDGSPAHLFNRANTYLLGYLTKENEMTQAQADKISLYARLLQFLTVEQANAFNASDTSYILSDIGDNIGQLLEDIYKSPEWSAANAKVVAYGKGGTVLAPGEYVVQ